MISHDVQGHPSRGGTCHALTEGLIAAKQAPRLRQAVQALPGLTDGTLDQFNVAMPAGTLAQAKPGLF